MVALQVLHGFTFGLFWGAAMAWLAECVPPELRATGQALYTTATFGIGNLIGYMGSGFLVDVSGGAQAAFLAAAAIEVVALAVILIFGRRLQPLPASARSAPPRTGACGSRPTSGPPGRAPGAPAPPPARADHRPGRRRALRARLMADPGTLLPGGTSRSNLVLAGTGPSSGQCDRSTPDRTQDRNRNPRRPSDVRPAPVLTGFHLARILLRQFTQPRVDVDRITSEASGGPHGKKFGHCRSVGLRIDGKSCLHIATR